MTGRASSRNKTARDWYLKGITITHLLRGDMIYEVGNNTGVHLIVRCEMKSILLVIVMLLLTSPVMAECKTTERTVGWFDLPRIQYLYERADFNAKNGGGPSLSGPGGNDTRPIAVQIREYLGNSSEDDIARGMATTILANMPVEVVGSNKGPITSVSDNLCKKSFVIFCRNYRRSRTWLLGKRY